MIRRVGLIARILSVIFSSPFSKITPFQRKVNDMAARNLGHHVRRSYNLVANALPIFLNAHRSHQFRPRLGVARVDEKDWYCRVTAFSNSTVMKRPRANRAIRDQAPRSIGVVWKSNCMAGR